MCNATSDAARHPQSRETAWDSHDKVSRNKGFRKRNRLLLARPSPNAPYAGQARDSSFRFGRSEIMPVVCSQAYSVAVHPALHSE